MRVLLEEELERDPVSVPESRMLLRPLTEYLMPHDQLTVRLLTSELVGNEVRHGEGHSPIVLRVEDHGGFLRFLVSADNPGFAPVAHDPGVESASGRGFLIVSQLAERFGVHKEGAEAAAWFDLICSRL